MKFFLSLVLVFWKQIGCLVVFENWVLEHFGLKTAASDGVKLWDLRKLKNFRSFAPYDATTTTNTGKWYCCLQTLCFRAELFVVAGLVVSFANRAAVGRVDD